MCSFHEAGLIPIKSERVFISFGRISLQTSNDSLQFIAWIIILKKQLVWNDPSNSLQARERDEESALTR